MKHLQQITRFRSRLESWGLAIRYNIVHFLQFVRTCHSPLIDWVVPSSHLSIWVQNYRRSNISGKPKDIYKTLAKMVAKAMSASMLWPLCFGALGLTAATDIGHYIKIAMNLSSASGSPSNSYPVPALYIHTCCVLVQQNLPLASKDHLLLRPPCRVPTIIHFDLCKKTA